MDYLTHLRDSVVSPLINNGLDGVAATIHIMQNYYLLREDIDSLMEISLWPNQKDPLSCVNSKVMIHSLKWNICYIHEERQASGVMLCVCSL